jgi:hypothetical protein
MRPARSNTSRSARPIVAEALRKVLAQVNLAQVAANQSGDRVLSERLVTLAAQAESLLQETSGRRNLH